MEFISEYGLFLLKAITIVIAILAAVSGIVSLTMRQHAGKQDETLELTDINEKYEAMNSALKQALLDPGAQKLAAKAEKKKRKAEAKQQAKEAKKRAKQDQPNEEQGAEKSICLFWILTATLEPLRWIPCAKKLQHC